MRGNDNLTAIHSLQSKVFNFQEFHRLSSFYFQCVWFRSSVPIKYSDGWGRFEVTGPLDIQALAEQHCVCTTSAPASCPVDHFQYFLARVRAKWVPAVWEHTRCQSHD